MANGGRNRNAAASQAANGLEVSAAAVPEAIAHGPTFPDSSDWPPTLAAALQRAAQTSATIRYVLADGSEIVQSYHDLWEEAIAIAQGLAAKGLSPGDFVILQFACCADFPSAFWGCVLNGCIPVPIPFSPVQSQPSSPLLAGLKFLEKAVVLTDQQLQDSLAALLTASPAEENPVNANPADANPSPTLLTLQELRHIGTPLSTQKETEPFTLPTVQPDELALLLLTSGSTGTPKGVMLTQQNLRVSAYGMATSNRLASSDLTLNWMPLEHVASLVMFHLTEIYLGCSQIHVANEVVLKNPLTWLDLIDRYRVTATWAPNFAYGLINDQLSPDPLQSDQKRHSWDLASLRWMGNGAEAIVGKTTRKFLQLLMPYGLSPHAVSPGYGMSETCSGIVHSHDFSLETTSDNDPFVRVGSPIPGVSVRIVDDQDQGVPEGVMGHLQVNGLTVMAGYYQPAISPSLEESPEESSNATAPIFDPNADAFTADGWFRTGDLGILQNGQLTITGRQKEVIILNGVNYYSHDIEAAVEELNWVEVSFTAACGVSRPGDSTEQLAIFFHPSETTNATAIRDSLIQNPKSKIQNPKLNPNEPLVTWVRQIRSQVMHRIGVVPTYVIPVEPKDIPKTAIGKIQRRQLSQQFAAGAFDNRLAQITQALETHQATLRETNGNGSLPPQTDLEQRIAQAWQSVLSVSVVGSHDNFFELGGTSLRLMQVLNHLQTDVEPSLTALDLFQYPTVASLAVQVSQRQSRPNSQNAPSASAQTQSSRRSNRHRSLESTEVAVIGMAGRFPGATNLEEFWQNLCNGVESITSFSEDELLASGIDPELIANPNYVNASPILENVEGFDAEFFDYRPKEAELMDPQQRLLLECAWECLEDAGYDPLTYPGLIGLYAGASMNTYLLNHVYPQRHTLDPHDSLEVMTLSSLGGFQMAIANDKDYLTTRVSYKLNLRGPSVNVQTACSTSLVAIHLAAQSVLHGECDLALAGGVSVETPQKAGHLYQEGMILSPDGHCRAFDAQAQGTLFGSGVGLVVLKRLDAAIADGDHIYAVIKGSAIGNDGGQKVGYLAPRSDGQTAVAADALAIADIPADTLAYVEAHGTGTALGDPIEVAGLTQAFRLSTSERQFCALGSVKSNVGHLNIASGVVSFIKAVLSIQHGQIPPSLHFSQPNPQIDFENSPFYVNTAPSPWPQTDTPRRASVNSLGIGGTNAHVVLEEAPTTILAHPSAHGTANGTANGATHPSQESSPAQIFTLSAKSESALRDLGQRYLTFLDNHPTVSLDDLCFTANQGRSHFPHRIAWVATSVTHLQHHLRDWLTHTSNRDATLPPPSSSPIAFLFTGQGAQSVGMGQELYDTQPVFRKVINDCATRLQSHGVNLLDLLYPDSPDSPDAPATPQSKIQNPKSKIHQTAYTQPALFAIDYALAQLWMSWGIHPSAVLGHSIGEYVAACLAGVFSLDDALKLVAARGRLMQALPPGGAMVSVKARATDLDGMVSSSIKTYGNEVAIAAINSPMDTVLSGSQRAIAHLTQQIEVAGLSYRPLQVSHAFHSLLMEPMLSEFRSVADSITYHLPTLEIISAVTGAIATDAIATPDYWVNQICQPVQFAQAIETLHHRQYRTFIECGPRPVLITLGQSTVPGTTALDTISESASRWLASLNPKHADRVQMFDSLATLYGDGHRIRWDAVYAGQSHRRLSLPTYPFQRQRYWLDRPTPPPSTNRPPTPSAGRKDNAHPLLGTAISTPFKHILFQQLITPSHPEFLSGHQLGHQIVFPGAAYLDMALSAGAIALKSPSIRIRTVAIERLLILSSTSSDDTYTLQTILTPEADGYRFEIYSQKQETAENAIDAEWTLHCSGAIAQAEPSTPEPLSIDAVRISLPEERSAADHYSRCEHLGLQYSGSFRAIQNLWRTDGTALAQVQLPPQGASDNSPYHLHPALLDACFQVVLAALPDTALSNAYVPIGVDCLRRYQPFPFASESSVWSYVQLHPTTQANAPVITADVRILDAQGHVIAFASGLSAKRITTTQFLTQPPDQHWKNWLYQVVWRPTPLSSPHLPTSPSRPSSTILLVANHPKKLTAIALHLEAQGYLCITVLLSHEEKTPADILIHHLVNINDPNGFQPILATVDHVQSVLYVAPNSDRMDETNVGLEPQGHSPLQTDCQHGLRGALYLTQALITRQSTHPAPKVWFVTQGVQSVLGTEALALAQSPLWGTGRAIALEHPELNCVCLDLDPDADEHQVLSDLEAELEAISYLSHSDEQVSRNHPSQVAYRQGIRYEARLVPAAHLSQNPALLNSGMNQTRATDNPMPDSSGRWPSASTTIIPQANAQASAQTTLQLQIAEQGTLEHLAWCPVSRRSPDADEVELQVTATGLNFRDVLNALGLYPGDAGPLGLECVGTVVAVGDAVSSVKVGDEVMAIASSSTTDKTPAAFSQFITVSAQLVAPLPKRLSPEEAATIPVTFLTAYYSLCELGRIAEPHPDGRAMRVLIHAAAGGVGQAAIQIAQQAGADIYATASPPKWDRLKQQDVRYLFNSRTLEFAEEIMRETNGQGVDVVLNSLSGDSIAKSLSVLAPGGTFLEIGKAGIWSAEQMAQHRPDVAYHVIDLVELTRTHPEQIHTMLSHLSKQVQQQQLQPLPMQVMRGDRAIDAFRMMQQGKHVGKVVITPPPVSPDPLVRSNATYLITGGLGALGLRVAEWLIQQGAQSLILLGRRSPSDTAQQTIQDLTHSGATVQVLQTDLADFASLQSALSPFLTAETSPLPPIKGIFHLAGCIDDGVLQQQTWERFESVMAAKVQGTWHLHQLSLALELDHMVFFSSAASLIGSAGQANYAAANAFLDAIAHYRRQQGLPALSINWGAWADSGMATSDAVNQRLTRSGQHRIPPDTGLAILAELMGTESVQKSLVQIGVLPGSGWIHPTDPLFSDLQRSERQESRTDQSSTHSGKVASASAPQTGGILQHLQAICQDADSPDISADESKDKSKGIRAEAQNLLSHHLRQQVATVLGLDMALLTDSQSGFTNLGIDSLTAIELRNRLQTSLERPFSATLIYDYPTLAALTDYLLNLVMPDESPSSDRPEPLPLDSGTNSLSAEAIAQLDDDEAEAQLLEELKRLEY